MTTTVRLVIGDVRDTLTRFIADGERFDFLCCSPPFWQLRSYLPGDHNHKHLEIGSEATPGQFLDTLFSLTEQWGRLLPEWGSVAVELGDTMSGSGGAGGDYADDGWRGGQPTPHVIPHSMHGGPDMALPKSMCILPHAYTLGLAYGHNPLTGQPHPAGQWRIRNVITWARPNPPVGSLGKRGLLKKNGTERNPQRRTGDYKFRPACSYITVACRGTGRYFDLDAVRHEHNEQYAQRRFTPPNGTVAGVPGQPMVRRVSDTVTVFGHPAGAPPLDWHTDDLDGDWLWKLATAPFKSAHYATYPLALPRRLVLAMAPLRVCTVCGWPSERVTGDATYIRSADSKPTNGDEAWRHGRRGINPGEGQNTNESMTAVVPTLGWTDCGHDAWRPGHVLDPFAGSGTTAVAAALEGRDCTLIDLDESNVPLVRRRLTETLRVLDETRTGDTITWTVTPAAPTELAAIANGQLDLFGEEVTAQEHP